MLLLHQKSEGPYKNKLSITVFTVLTFLSFSTPRYSGTFGLWEVDVTSGLFRASQGSSMADTGVVETLLQRIEKVDDGVDSLEVASSLGVDHQVIVGAVKSLQALGDVSNPDCGAAEDRLLPSTLSVHWDWCNKDGSVKEKTPVSQKCLGEPCLVSPTVCDIDESTPVHWASQKEYLHC